jgi:phage terminase Nu1 subunit (DNA packaging protein)
MQKESFVKIENLSGVELAKCFGIGPNAVSAFKKAGMPHKNGRYNLPACIQWRIARAGGGETKESDSKDGEWLEEYRKQKAKIARLELRRLRGDLVPAGEAEAVIVEAVTAAKNAFLSAPRKLAARLYGLDPREIESAISEEIREILTRLSNRKISTSKEQQHETIENEESVVETPKRRARSVATTGKTDGKRMGGKASRPGRNDKRGSRRVAK